MQVEIDKMQSVYEEVVRQSAYWSLVDPTASNYLGVAYRAIRLAQKAIEAHQRKEDNDDRHTT